MADIVKSGCSTQQTCSVERNSTPAPFSVESQTCCISFCQCWLENTRCRYSRPFMQFYRNDWSLRRFRADFHTVRDSRWRTNKLEQTIDLRVSAS